MGSSILIVDDQPDSSAALGKLLDAYLPEAELATAETAADGLAQAAARPFDLILLDVKLPDMSGFDACRTLKSGAGTRDTPVLLVSGVMVDTRHRAHGLNVGADGYLCKPFEPPEFIAQVKSLLRLRRSTQSLREREKTLEAELEQRAGDLRESEAKYRTLVEALPFAVMIAQDHRVVFANRATAVVLGLGSADEALGRDPLAFVAPRDRERIAGALLSRAKGDGVPRQYELALCRADGSEFAAEQYVTRIAYRGAPADQIIAMDITARREAEEALLRSTEQLRQAQKLEALGRLSGGIAHDFNNLLTSILGYSRMLGDDSALSDAQRTDIAEIVHAGERAAELTEQLLAFGHKHPVEMQPLELNEVVRQMDRLLRRTLGEDVELVTLFGEDLGTVLADAGQIEQVIMNLAVNARDAMPSGGKLKIQTSRRCLDEAFCLSRAGLRAGDYVVLEVIDTGTGMAPEVRERAFEPFFTTKRKGEGTGLGLSTVYGIVQQCQGYVEMESALGQGTNVWMCFPVISTRVAPPDAVRRPPVPHGRETVLVVEDDSAVRRLTSRILASLGYTVLEAGNAGEAILAFETHASPVDLVLADIVMPHIGGVELVRRLYKTGRPFRTLYMTGFTQEAFVRRTEDERRTPILLKPYTREDLAHRVRQALDA